MLVRIYQEPEDIVAAYFESQADESEDAAVVHADGREAHDQKAVVASIQDRGCWAFVDANEEVPVAHVWTSDRQGLREVIGLMAGNLAAAMASDCPEEAQNLMQHYTEIAQSAFDLALQALSGDQDSPLSPVGRLH